MDVYRYQTPEGFDNMLMCVDGVVGWNPICLIIPCHHVKGADGKLTGYGGGMHNKIALLKHEGSCLI